MSNLNDGFELEGTRIAGRKRQFKSEEQLESDQIGDYKIGDTIGDTYEVLAIHRGGMGVVYSTLDVNTRLPRALKSLQTRFVRDVQMKRMFFEEASLWVKLERFPYIARAYHVETFNHRPYVITDYVSGPSGMGSDLRSWLGKPILTLPIASSIALKVAQGMQFAVAKVPGMVHRDLKPANILINDRATPSISDFGLAGAENSFAGTPAYMAPEQWQSGRIDMRTDIYAFGVILFELLTGNRVTEATTMEQWKTFHLIGTPFVPQSLNQKLDIGISNFILKCMAKDPLSRPQHWNDVVEYLGCWYKSLTGIAPQYEFSQLELDAEESVEACVNLIALGKLEDALRAGSRALAIKESAWAWMNLAVALQKLGRYEESIEASNRAISMSVGWPKVRFNKAATLYHMGNISEALALVESTLLDDPDNIEGLEMKAIQLIQNRKYEDGCKILTKIISATGGTALMFQNRGTALSKLGKMESALLDYDAALDIEPENWQAVYNKALLLIELKRFAEAIESCSTYLSSASSAQIFYLRGSCYYYLQQYKTAIEDFKIALDTTPNHLNALIGIGNSLQYIGQHGKAIEFYDRAMTIDPTNKLLLTNRIIALDKINAAVGSTHATKDANAGNAGGFFKGLFKRR